MIRLKSMADEFNGVVTYKLADGRYVRLDARAVAEYGAGEMLRRMGLGDQIPTKRAPVLQGGHQVGTVPGDFDPMAIKSRSFMYDPRPGDFVRKGDHWIASNSLGTGDLGAIPGFRFEDGTPR